jgi:hypothetical protein
VNANALRHRTLTIEVAWAFEEGRSEDFLTRPAPEWTDCRPLALRIAVYCCHCLTCQSWSGSASASRPSYPRQRSQRQGSGSTSHQRLCGICHARLWNTNSARLGIAVVRAGTPDASDTLEPRARIWAKRKQPWIVVAGGVPTFEESAPPAEFAAILIGK